MRYTTNAVALNGLGALSRGRRHRRRGRRHLRGLSNAPDASMVVDVDGMQQLLAQIQAMFDNGVISAECYNRAKGIISNAVTSLSMPSMDDIAFLQKVASGNGDCKAASGGSGSNWHWGEFLAGNGLGMIIGIIVGRKSKR